MLTKKYLKLKVVKIRLATLRNLVKISMLPESAMNLSLKMRKVRKSVVDGSNFAVNRMCGCSWNGKW